MRTTHHPTPTTGPSIWRSQTDSVQQTLAIGQAIAQHAAARDVIALTGELGAGKTQLVRGLAKGLGIDDAAVSSPTFVLMQQYAPPAGGPVLWHADAYRLEPHDDPTALGWGTDLFDDTIVAIEWADRFAEHLPVDRLEIRLTHHSATRRGVSIAAYGSWSDRMPNLRQTFDRLGLSQPDRTD